LPRHRRTARYAYPPPVAADWQGKPRRILLRLQRVCIPDATRRRGLLGCGSCSPPRAGMVSVPVQPPRRFPAGRKKGVSIPLSAGHLPCHCAEGLAYPLRVTNAFLQYFRHNLPSLVSGERAGSPEGESRLSLRRSSVYGAHALKNDARILSLTSWAGRTLAVLYGPSSPPHCALCGKSCLPGNPVPACTRTVSWTLFGAGRARLG
jgi:hypothetical protein